METAITMPLVVFMILGTLQLFMLLQGRLMAEHAAFKAVRAGVVNHGDCTVMTHAAIAALLPSFSSFLGQSTPGGSPQEKLANAFRARTAGKPFGNAYDTQLDRLAWGTATGTVALNRPIVWVFRPSPLVGDVNAQSEEDFDDPDPVVRGNPPAQQFGYRLEVRLVYWMPMRIPFANWVMATMLRAYFGLGDYTGFVNPTLPVSQARWRAEASAQSLNGPMAAEFQTRFGLNQYSFPISASAAMRMMTPPRPQTFTTQHCPPAPP